MDGNATGQNHRENLNPQDASGAVGGFENFNVPSALEANKEMSGIEVGGETEQAITQGEQQPVGDGAATTPVPVIIPQVPVGAATVASTRANNDSELPLVAGHSDKIEKQWVEMGEKIIENTKNDPHEQKTQIDGLKDKYQTTRYGSREG